MPFIENITVVNPYRFYTYAYLRENKSPYYIGKGSKNRICNTNGRPCGKPKDKSRIIFLKQNLTEEEAFKHEIYMIAVFGRKDLGTGILLNKTDGGEGTSGHIVNEKSRIRQSNSMKGKFHTQEHKRKKSEAVKGKNNPNYGKKWWNDGCGNSKMSIKCPGEGWVLGMSKKTKIKRSKVNKKLGIKPPSPKGKKWWNDGCGNSKMSIKCPGEGWVLGRGKTRTL